MGRISACLVKALLASIEDDCVRALHTKIAFKKIHDGVDILLVSRGDIGLVCLERFEILDQGLFFILREQGAKLVSTAAITFHRGAVCSDSHGRRAIGLLGCKANIDNVINRPDLKTGRPSGGGSQ